MTKRRRSESADPLEAASPSVAPVKALPSDFPELQGSAKRFAGLSPKAQRLNSASPHRPALGKTASPTIRDMFSRQAANQSPNGAKPSSSPASAAGKPTSANQAAANGRKLLTPSRCVQRQSSVVADSAVPEHSPEKQHDRHLVKQAAGMLSEVLSASPAGKAACRRSIERGEREGQPTASNAAARHQHSSPTSPESSVAKQASGADEQAIDINNPAGKGEANAPLPGNARMQSGASPGRKARQKQDRKSMAEVIDLSQV